MQAHCMVPLWQVRKDVLWGKVMPHVKGKKGGLQI